MHYEILKFVNFQQLLDENVSLKERTKYVNRKPLDPNAEINLLRKENERFQREIRNLAKSLEARKEELETMEKRLRRADQASHERSNTENWEERKRHGQVVAALKKRIEDLESKEVQFEEKLERRDKHIEQLSKEHALRSVDATRNGILSKELREMKVNFEQEELKLNTQLQVLLNRLQEANRQMEILTKVSHYI